MEPKVAPKSNKGMLVFALGLILVMVSSTIAALIFYDGNKSQQSGSGSGSENGDSGNSITNEQTAEITVTPSCGSTKGLVASSLRGTSSWPDGDNAIASGHNDISEGCSRLDWNTTVAQTACNNSFEESTDGTFHNCKWNSDDTCSAETEECAPETAGSTDKPYCTSGVWQPWHNLGGTLPEGNDSQYCYCRRGDTGINFKTGVKAVSRCLLSTSHNGNFPEVFNSGQAP